MFCPICSNEIADGSTFCGFCGNQIGGQIPPQQFDGMQQPFDHIPGQEAQQQPVPPQQFDPMQQPYQQPAQPQYPGYNQPVNLSNQRNAGGYGMPQLANDKGSNNMVVGIVVIVLVIALLVIGGFLIFKGVKALTKEIGKSSSAAQSDAYEVIMIDEDF